VAAARIVEPLDIFEHVGPHPVRWIGTRAYEGRFIAGNILALPVCFKRGALAPNVPRRDLWLSPGHGVRVGDALIPAWRLVNGVTITQAENVGRVDYFHVELDEHGLLVAEGAEVESYLDIGTRGQFQNAATAPATPQGLTAVLPRVEDGFVLAESQARLARRAGVFAETGARGPLRGFIDETAGRLTGWAQDVANPETPVELEVLCDGAAVARVLANGFRADLRAAGLGSGCHAFYLTQPPQQSRVTVRRAADGATLVRARVAA